MTSRGGEGDALEDCLARLRAGAPGAMDVLCAHLRPVTEAMVRRSLSARGRRWDQVDDLVQGIQIEVVRELARRPLPLSARELLQRVGRIASLRVKDALRNHGKLVGESGVAIGRQASAALARSTGAITAADRRRMLEQLIARLPEKHAVVVRLCGLEELSCAEAARRLGLEPDTVRKRYEAARQALARRLGRDWSV